MTINVFTTEEIVKFALLSDENLQKEVFDRKTTIRNIIKKYGIDWRELVSFNESGIIDKLNKEIESIERIYFTKKERLTDEV